MNVGQAGAAPQQQPQIRTLERIQFTDDAGQTYGTFENVRATRTADTNQTRKGFGIDLNNDGRYNKETDGLLAFDLDGDGKYTSTDVETTQQYLRAMAGEEDLNGDGQVSFKERSDAHNMMKHFGSADLDQDGVLQGWEIAELGGMVVRLGTDEEGNPTSSIQNLPGFEADRKPAQPNPLDPASIPPNPEFEAWQKQSWDIWGNMLGFDIAGIMTGSSPFPNLMQFPPTGPSMFGGGGGGGMGFPMFNFPGFDPMAGQTFGANGFPSFMTTGVGFI